MRKGNKKISYERRVYESVDDRSLSYSAYLKPVSVNKG